MHPDHKIFFSLFWTTMYSNTMVVSEVASTVELRSHVQKEEFISTFSQVPPWELRMFFSTLCTIIEKDCRETESLYIYGRPKKLLFYISAFFSRLIVEIYHYLTLSWLESLNQT